MSGELTQIETKSMARDPKTYRAVVRNWRREFKRALKKYRRQQEKEHGTSEERPACILEYKPGNGQ